MIEIKAYQGLIRNHAELAEELGLSISGCTRQEREEKIVVAAYQAWGTDMGNHLNGQFGIALYDTEAEELFCCRDILGAELFFYYLTDDGDLLYGIRIKDLFDKPGFKKELNEELIQFYLGFSYVPGEETLFKGVYKLEPGGYLTFGKEGLKVDRYWELTFEPDESKTLDDWADEISDAMDASMKCVVDPGQHVDSFLSGGVDSSYMLAKGPAETGFCCAYANQEASEEEDAKATAEYLGRGFKGIEVTPEDFFANLDEFIVAYEQPQADAAGLSLYCAAKQLAGTCEVVFSGEGADEFFAGYNGYQNADSFTKQKNPVYYGATQSMRELDQKHYLKRFYPNRDAADFMRKRGEAGRKYDPVSWMLYVDIRSYFEASILFNSTKIVEGTGLDIRMPFCDLRIFDIARRMPSRFKVGDGGNKLALRRAASRVLPQEVAYRKKLGFPVPIRDWLADPAYNGDIVRAFDSETAAKFFNQKEIKALLNYFTTGKTNLWHKLRYRGNKAALWRRVWSIYVFIRWYELFFVEEN